MMLTAAEVFHNAHLVNNRFHVQQVYSEPVDEIRIDIRRQLIAEENNRDRSLANIFQRRDHASDPGAQQAHADDVTE